MALIKICPSCGFANPASEMMCEKCAAFIADAALTEEGAPERPEETPEIADSGATVRISGTVSFCDQSGAVVFSASDGDIIGRLGAGAEYLASIPTVSRRHCRLALTLNGWAIEDLDSVNGTWINGSQIAALTPLSNGDMVSLSKACELRIKL